MLKKDTDIHDCDLPNEEVGLLVIAAEKKSILWCGQLWS